MHNTSYGKVTWWHIDDEGTWVEIDTEPVIINWRREMEEW